MTDPFSTATRPVAAPAMLGGESPEATPTTANMLAAAVISLEEAAPATSSIGTLPIAGPEMLGLESGSGSYETASAPTGAANALMTATAAQQHVAAPIASSDATTPAVRAKQHETTTPWTTAAVSLSESAPVTSRIATRPAFPAAIMPPTMLNIAGAPIEVAPVRDRPALIAVAHGSRDPRSAATVTAVVTELAAARPGFDVRLAFLDLNAPSVEQVVDAVAAQGHTHAVVVPLLLGNAFHARVDLPGLLAAAHARHPQLRLTQADVLGPDVRLIAALRDRVSEASASLDSAGRPGIAVAAVGSSSPAANARTTEVARRLAALTGHRTEICFATTEPALPQAISRLRTRGAENILVAPWFLAPGLLTDRLVTAAPEVLHAQVIGPHPALTDIVWHRYDAATTNALTLSA